MNLKNSCNLYHKPMEKDRGTESGEHSGEAAKDVSDEEEGARHNNQPPGTALPGGDPDEMYRTLTQRLARLPETTVLYPGHDYGSVPFRTLSEERKQNGALLAPSLEVWRRMMG